MATKNLSSLLGSIQEKSEAETKAKQKVPEEADVVPIPDKKPHPRKATTKTATAVRTPSAAEREALPRYLELDRKEARLATEQLEELSKITRRLNKSRRGRGERITDNTLIRVAVDMLLAKQGELEGTTESELRKSVGL